jgi:pimeloyl-ACP methyl ester carboxylesterase
MSARWWLFPALALVACRAAPLPPEARWPAGTTLSARSRIVDGTRIRYIDAGAGPAVVLIHGFGASMYSWRYAIPPLVAAGYRVVAFDDRGFGFSDRPDSGYANADYVRLAVALLDTLRITDAVLVGHSMGGEIAAEVALAHPERVRALALIDAAGWEVHWPLLLTAARWRISGGIASGVRGRNLTARILRSMYADASKVTEQDIDQYYAPVGAPDYGQTLRGVLRDYRFDALRGRLSAIQAPTLLLWGTGDRLIPPAVGRRMAAELPRAAFVLVPRAGHAAPEEQPEAVNRLLVTFLKEGLPKVPENLALHYISSTIWLRKSGSAS